MNFIAGTIQVIRPYFKLKSFGFIACVIRYIDTLNKQNGNCNIRLINILWRIEGFFCRGNCGNDQQIS
jgi:hypothetical protein